jgi:integrase
MKVTQPIRDKHHVAQLLSYYHKKGDTRNNLLINLCIYTALRISDVLSLVAEDVYDFRNCCVRKYITITEKKTGKTKTIALHKNLITVLQLTFSGAKPTPKTPLILNKRTNKAISRIQAYRIIRKAAEDIGIPYSVSCHSLRKVFGYHCWKTGVYTSTIMEAYNHSAYPTTRRYLGISQNDVDNAYLRLNFY